jgi:hypothetical protein
MDFIKEFIEISKYSYAYDVSLQIDKRDKTHQHLIITVRGDMYRGLDKDSEGEYSTVIPLMELEKEENLTEFVYEQIKNTIREFEERI